MRTSILISAAILVFILSSNTAQSQVPVRDSELILERLRLNKGISGEETASYSDINGNPYLFQDFTRGVITVTSGQKTEANIRFDIYANEMHIKDRGDIFAIIHPEKMKFMEVDGLKFIYSKYIKSPGEESAKDGSYFILKSDGKCKLLVRKNMRIQDAEPPKLYQDAKPAKFIPTSDIYYLKLNDESAVKIKNEKELLSILADQREALSNYIRTNKFQVKEINDLEKIITYYNSL